MRRPSIVFLAHFGWDTHFMQFHKELLFRFAQLGWDTLWVSGPIQLRLEPRHWIRYFFRGILKHEGQVWHYQPWALPGLRFGSKFPLSYKLMAYCIKRVFHKLNFIQPVILVYTPHELELLKLLPHSSSIYWTGDEVIIPGEAQLLDYVNTILAVSPVAYEEKRRSRPQKTFQVPTGVAFEKFNKALSSDYVPPDMKNLKRPIIGYAGGIWSTRVDLKLVHLLAQKNPECSFILVGPIEKQAEEFFEKNSLPNIYLLGSRPYDEVPYYIKCFDICVIPYLLNRFNLGSNPLKMYEYLSLGKPVVTTAIPAFEKFSDIILIAHNQEKFHKLIEQAFAEKDNPVRVQQRLQVAMEHSAQNIVAQMTKILEHANAS